jgi:hypothetical protein
MPFADSGQAPRVEKHQRPVPIYMIGIGRCLLYNLPCGVVRRTVPVRNYRNLGVVHPVSLGRVRWVEP